MHRLAAAAATAIPKSLIKRSLEVERKFVPTTPLMNALIAEKSEHKYPWVPKLRSNPAFFPSPIHGRSRIFQGVQHLGEEGLLDRYYDEDDLLCSRGVWLRQRFHHTYGDLSRDNLGERTIRLTDLNISEGDWEAKVARGGDYANSRFLELDSHEEIESVVRMCMVEAGIQDKSRKQNFGLKRWLELGTVRESWYIDGKFTVAVDETDWGHRIGEVELIETVT